ncbi:MAG: hypothetical protein LBJ87_00805, partial [bacterium]|nr:hypothetical protein [bacterium]
MSINPACFHPRTSLREFLQVSSAAGFGCVEISIQQAMALADDLGGLAVLARVGSDLGLQIGQFSGLLPAGPVLPAPLLVGQRAWHAAQSSLAARLEAGAALGCHKAAVTCNPRTNLNLKEARRIAALRLTTLATEASRYGVT